MSGPLSRRLLQRRRWCACLHFSSAMLRDHKGPGQVGMRLSYRRPAVFVVVGLASAEPTVERSILQVRALDHLNAHLHDKGRRYTRLCLCTYIAHLSFDLRHNRSSETERRSQFFGRVFCHAKSYIQIDVVCRVSMTLVRPAQHLHVFDSHKDIRPGCTMVLRGHSRRRFVKIPRGSPASVFLLRVILTLVVIKL